MGGFYDGDDVNVKGDDGSDGGARITSTTDGAKKRLDTSALIYGAGGTAIGNVGDRLKVDSVVTIVPAASTFGNVAKSAEVSVTSKSVTDVAGTTYTVPTAKTFILTCMAANYDTQAPMVVRLMKQTGGSGAFAFTGVRITVKQHGQDSSHGFVPIPFGVAMGTAGDVFKLQYESALARGSLYAAFFGIEY